MSANNAIIEAVARALQNGTHAVYSYDNALEFARIMLTTATPLIRSQVLEEAARVAMDHPSGSYEVAIAIRALKEQP